MSAARAARRAALKPYRKFSHTGIPGGPSQEASQGPGRNPRGPGQGQAPCGAFTGRWFPPIVVSTVPACLMGVTG